MKAHRIASSADQGTVNFNPFARVRSRDSVQDPESHPGRTRSEGDFVPAIEEERRTGSREAEEDFPAPHHVDTAPPISPTSAHQSAGAHHGKGGPPQSKESADISDKTAVEANGSGPSKRGKFKHIFRKSTDENGVDDAEAVKLDKEERKRRALKKKIPLGAQIRAVLFGSWINVLLVFVPVGFAVNYAHIQPVPIFVINFIAIIPLAAMLSYATEELAIRVGETLGGLLNATFG